MEDFYVRLFAEAYWRFFLVPLDAQVTLPAMREFGGYDLLFPNLVTGIGIMLAMATSFVIGQALGLLRPHYFVKILPNPLSANIRHPLRRYGWMGIFLVGLPLGTVIPLILGFLYNDILLCRKHMRRRWRS